MKRCPKCNRTYAKEEQKFCPSDGTRLEQAEEEQFDPLKTMVATPKRDEPESAAPPPPLPSPAPMPAPVAAEDVEDAADFDPLATMVATPAAKAAEPEPVPAPALEEEEPVGFDPLRTMLAKPASSGADAAPPTRVESAPLSIPQEQPVAFSERRDEPAPTSTPSSQDEPDFDPLKTMMATPATQTSGLPAPNTSEPSVSKMSEPSAPPQAMPSPAAPPPAPFAFDDERTIDRAPSVPLSSAPATPFATPAPDAPPAQYEAAPAPDMQPQAAIVDWEAPQAPMPNAMPAQAVAAPTRKGAARVSMILGLLSLLMVLIFVVTKMMARFAFFTIAPLMGSALGNVSVTNIVYYVLMLLFFLITFIAFVLGLVGLFKAFRQPLKSGGKLLATIGILTSLLAVIIFVVSFAYYAMTFIKMLQT